MLTLKTDQRFGFLNLRSTVSLLIAGLAMADLSLAQLADGNSAANFGAAMAAMVARNAASSSILSALGSQQLL